MLATLRIENGSLVGRRVHLRPGQVLRVGRTEWADLAVGADADLAEIHFALELTPAGCQLRDLESGRETLVNDAPVSQTVLSDGDRITAGGTLFLVTLEEAAVKSAAGHALSGAGGAGGVSGDESGFAMVEPPRAVTVAEHCRLSEAAKPLLDGQPNVRAFFDCLQSQGLWHDAVKFMAHALPKREAVWWAILACRDTTTGEIDTKALAAAEQWVVDPNEDHRVAAMLAGEDTGHKGAAGWVALAAGWSGGSLTAPGLPEVAPDEHLTAQAVSNSVLLSASSPASETQKTQFQAILAVGVDVADGKNRWEVEAVEPRD